MTLVELLSVVGGLITCGLFFDLVAEDRHKYSVSLYVFGYSEADFSGFESGVIRVLMRPLTRDGSPRLRRTALYSFCFNMIVFALVSAEVFFPANYDGHVLGYSEINVPDGFIGVCILVILWSLVMTLFTFFYDLWSLTVTAHFFLTETVRFPWTIVAMIADAFFSLAGVMLITVAIVMTNSGGSAELQQSLTFAIAIASALLITALQVAILCVGLTLRTLTMFLNVNRLFVRYSKLADYPFTFIFILGGCLIYAVYNILAS